MNKYPRISEMGEEFKRELLKEIHDATQNIVRTHVYDVVKQVIEERANQGLKDLTNQFLATLLLRESPKGDNK